MESYDTMEYVQHTRGQT